VWQKAHQLTLETYQATQSFPADECYGLTSQMRRAAASIPANIAEGCGRSTDGDFARFMQIAMGFTSELEYHLLLAHDLKILDGQLYPGLNQSVVEAKRMLTAFIQKLKADR
jgi:four helix bundle protein